MNVDGRHLGREGRDQVSAGGVDVEEAVVATHDRAATQAVVLDGRRVERLRFVVGGDGQDARVLDFSASAAGEHAAPAKPSVRITATQTRPLRRIEGIFIYRRLNRVVLLDWMQTVRATTATGPPRAWSTCSP